MEKRLRLRAGGVLATAAVVIGAQTAPAMAYDGAAADPPTMVALGDSQAAGPLVTTQNSWDCLRSDDNWPSVAARTIGASLTDVTCSGATTADLTGRRFGYMAPQLDAVGPGTDIVTITIGANDLNLGVLVPSCMQPLPAPHGIACSSYQPDSYTSQIDTVGKRIADAVQSVHTRAPGADVHLVSYLTYWGTSGCYPVDPIWAIDAAWLQSIFDRLNAKLSAVAADNGAGYIDLATPSRDHGVCAPVEAKWVEGLIPTSQAAPYHPNALGNREGGAIVAGAIRD
ncbi:SGNH/GDSL hydrolase family protein [Nocardioides sp. NPDC006273]|uniref:SGNH/GDSL hydrolase family protein n=1 Tax=Nocardioides sp. NPDC006273 TaxID=3155598 RepID=UPI0033B30997